MSSSAQYGKQQTTLAMGESGQLPPESFMGQIIFSCIATWLCFCPLGLGAFILAMRAQKEANTNKEKAHKLGVASYVVSGVAVVVTIIFAIIYWTAIYPNEKSQS